MSSVSDPLPLYQASRPPAVVVFPLIQQCPEGIDQPVGAGFSPGTPTANSTEELAPQFLGFWKNFIDTFDLKGSKVYLTGESYAGVSYLSRGIVGDLGTTEEAKLVLAAIHSLLRIGHA